MKITGPGMSMERQDITTYSNILMELRLEDQGHYPAGMSWSNDVETTLYQRL